MNPQVNISKLLICKSKKIRLISFAVFLILHGAFILTSNAEYFLYTLCFLLIYEIYAVLKHEKTVSFNLPPLSQYKSYSLYALSGAVVSLLYFTGLFILSKFTFIDIINHKLLKDVSFNWASVLVLAVLPSLYEEIYFRHFCQGRFLQNYNKIIRISIPTLIFVYLHVSIYSVSISGFLTVTALLPTSVTLAIIYEKSESVIPPIIFHFIGNTSIIAILAIFI